AALAVIVVVLVFSSRRGGRGRERTVSLRRGPRAHTTRDGRAKVGYATRSDALSQARQLARRDDVPMGVYQCPTCRQWHVGHS
ncbi:MAG TPA: hypothetical protein VIC81_03020, partial [Acidimicrobiales bacterium]